MTKTCRQLPHRTAALLGLLVFSLPLTAAASGDTRPAFFAFVSKACMHQDPAHRSSSFGKRLESSHAFIGWDRYDATPKARCLKERRWVSAELCASAARVDVAQKDQVNEWFAAHTAEAKRLAPVFRFVNSQETPADACPAITLGE